MTDQPLDAPLLDHTDASLARPLPAALRTARIDVLAGARDLAAIPEAALADEWPWNGGEEVEVRYAAYRAAEALEAAEVEARRLSPSTPGAPSAPRTTGSPVTTAAIVAPATAARWDLHGLLLPLEERLLDADPGAGEWSLRLVLGHIIVSQRAYGWANAWIGAHPEAAAEPGQRVRVPDAFWDALPDEATTEAEGSLDDLRARFDAITDLSIERLAGFREDGLDIPTRWSGADVSLGFRFGRWSSHIREHTIQVEKTLAMLGHVPDEPARLVRHVLAAYGRAEATIIGREDVDESAETIARAAAEGRHALHGAREAAGA